jgi:hypothetical protein
MAKMNDGGQSWIEGKSLEWLVTSHIGYVKPKSKDEIASEQFSSFHSPLISFSEEAKESFKYLDRTKKLDFEDAELSEATHFIWKLENLEAEEVVKGVYRIVYKASTDNVKHFLNEELSRGLTMGGVAKMIVHQNIENDSSDHYALLIDVVTYLENNPNPIGVELEVFERAKFFSSRDKEWLLYPQDPMKDGRGFDARFTLNIHLSLLHWMKVKNDKN